MKTTNLIATLCLLALFSCNSEEKSTAPQAIFELYETVNITEIPAFIIKNLQDTAIRFENNAESPIIGYVQKKDSLVIRTGLTLDNIKFERSSYPVNKEGQLYAIVALKRVPVIGNSDIKSTRPKGITVEIYFNWKGARKWADMTRNNMGKTVAFTINGRMYSMPLIQGEIRNGIALLTGLENEAMARNISALLNSSVTR